MKECEVCGNKYDKILEVHHMGSTHFFDSFECAIHAMAPHCTHCHCSIIGHGLESDGRMFCCASCARLSGEDDLQDRADHPAHRAKRPNGMGRAKVAH